MEQPHLLLVLLVEHVGKAALATVLAVMVGSHENTSTAPFLGAFPPKAGDLAILVDLVVLEDSELYPLLLVL